MNNVWTSLVLSTALLINIGCSRESESSDVVPRACDPDEALLAERIECRADDDCPCSAHCYLGLCTSDCIEDAGCPEDGQRCDDFGECRDADDPNRIALPQTAARGQIQVSPATLSFFGDEPRRLVLEAAAVAVAPVRVAAGDGVTIECTEGAGFVEECELPSLDVGTPVAIAVRYAPGSATAGIPAVRVFGPKQVRVVGVSDGTTLAAVDELARRNDPLSSPASSLQGPVAAAAPSAGEYVGVMRLRRLQADVALPNAEHAEDPIGGGLDDFAIPIRAEVFADNQVIRLRDEGGVFLPGGELVGFLDVFDGTSLLEFEDVHFLGPDAPTVEDLEILAEISAPELFVHTDTTLRGTLELDFYGSIGEGQRVRSEWELELARAGDLAPGLAPPPLPSKYTPAQNPGQRQVAKDALTATVLAADADSCLGPLDVGGNLNGDDCAQGVLCWVESEGGFAPPSILSASRLDPSVALDKRSGDTRCERTELPDPHSQQAFPIYDESLAATADIAFDDCLAEIAVPPTGSTLPELFADAGCLNQARVHTALWLARDENEGFTPLGGRVLSQYLDVASFVTREASQRELLALAVGDDAGTQADQALVAAEPLLDALLHPRLAHGLAAADANVFANPDYRDAGGMSVGEAGDDQSQGVPVAMLGTAVSQLEALDHLLELAHFDGDSAKQEQLRRRARHQIARGLLLVGLASSLHEVGRQVADPVDWERQWDGRLARFTLAAGRITGRLQSIARGDNALGISDEDLPQTFTGVKETARERFSAIGDYLLAGEDIGGFVKVAVDSADDQLDTVRVTWEGKQDRVLFANQQDSRIDEVKRSYGREIATLCDPSLSDLTALDEPIIADACYRVFDTPACLGPDPGDPVARLYGISPEAMLEQICKQAAFAAIGSELYDDETMTSAAKRYAETPGGIDELWDGMRVDPASGLVVNLAGEEFVFSVESFPLQANENEELVRRSGDNRVLEINGSIAPIGSQCRALAARIAGRRPLTSPGSCTQTDQCAENEICLGAYVGTGTCIDMEKPSNDPSCYRGTMGELALAVRGAAADVDAARQAIQDHYENYRVKMDTCGIIEGSNNDILEQQQAHNDNLEDLAVAKAVADSAAAVADEVQEATDSPLGLPMKFGPSQAAAIVAAAAKVASIALQAEIDNQIRDHQEKTLQLENAKEEATCRNEGLVELVGIQGAIFELNGAQADLGAQALALENAKVEVAKLLAEGRANVAEEEGRAVVSIGHDKWLTEAVSAYQHEFRQARRLTYLAVLAREYEFQQTLGALREETVAADNPSDLQVIYSELLGLGPSSLPAPTDDFEVFSLKDDLLAVEELVALVPGAASLSADERLRLALTRKEWTVHDPVTGAVKGQRVPFTLQPGGFSATTCAERIWSVGAQVVTDDPQTGDDPRVELQLRKQNLFYSQWCSGRSDGSDHQEASVRPERNLFVEPTGDGALPATESYTLARIQARQDSETGAFYATGYADEQQVSEELATRALFGRYELFIPVDSYRGKDPVTNEVTNVDALDLTLVGDILIRIDYVSVSQ